MPADQIVKVDRIGRIKTPRERREVLLAEFDRSGMSGQQFAKWAGIKYGTFITWVQKRRRKSVVAATANKAEGKEEVRWVEAVMEKATPPKQSSPTVAGAMIVPGASGLRLELSEERHVRKRPAGSLYRDGTSCPL
ncbi:MAG: hypothetical protein WDO13_11540 [Verrucomicrobiota bacterium]